MSRDTEDEHYRKFYIKYGCTLGEASDFLFRRALGKTRNLDDAYDLTHDALLRLIETDPVGSVINWESYMISVINRLYIDSFIRAGHRREIPSENIPEYSKNNPGPEDQVVFEDLRRGFWQAIDMLEPMYREVVRLRFCHCTLEIQRTYSEIAEILRVPVGTVGSRLHYALEKLRRRFESGDGEGAKWTGK
jgi:RNA polymerase sigma factor (sigma-70 family)